MLSFGRVERFLRSEKQERLTISFTEGIPYEIWCQVRKKLGNPMTAGGFFGIDVGWDALDGKYFIDKRKDNCLFFEDHKGNRTYFKYELSDEEIIDHYKHVTDYGFRINTDITTRRDKDIKGAEEGAGIDITFSIVDKGNNPLFSEEHQNVNLKDLGFLTDAFVRNLPRDITEPTNKSCIITLGTKSREQYDELLEMSTNPDNHFSFLTKNVILAPEGNPAVLEDYLVSHNIIHSIDHEPAKIYEDREQF